jgi:glycosyltransferase involved in cell wall biosynthesis
MGGSIDGTLDIVNRYDHIKLIHQTDNDGMYRAIDIGFNFAKGTYVTWVNSDDKIIPKNYEILYKRAIEQEASLIYSDAIYHFIDKHKYKYVPAFAICKIFFKEWHCSVCSAKLYFLKSFYDDVGGLNCY